MARQYWESKRALPTPPSRSHERVPVAVGPERRQVVLEEVDGVLLDAGRRLGGGLVPVVEDAAEVADRAHAVSDRPCLARDQVAHVAVGVERLDVAAGDGVAAEGPAELRRGAVGPELEGLRLDGERGLDGLGEARVLGDQVLAELAEGADRDPEDDLVEVHVALQGALGSRQGVELGLEVHALGRRFELVPEGLAGPGREVLDGVQRVVFGDLRRQFALADDVDLGDVAVGGAQGGDGVEELELDAALLEDLVERGEDDVAHPRLHLEHDRAAVAEDELEQVAGGGASGAVGLGDVAVAVGEGDVVDGAQDGGALGGGAAEGDLAGAVAAEPVAPLLVVEGVEAVLEDVVLDDAGDHRDAGVDHREEEAQVRVTVDAAGDDGAPEPLAECLQQADEEEGGGGVAGEAVVGVVGAELGEPLGDAEQALAEVDGQLDEVAGEVAGEVLEPVGDQVVLGARREVVARVAQVAPAVQGPAEGGGGHLPEGGELARVAGDEEVAREGEGEGLPAVALAVVEDDLVAALEGVVEGGEGGAGRAGELGIGVAHEAEGVVVEAEPDVEAVLLDAVGDFRVATAGALAAVAPAELVDGDVVALAQLLRGGQLEGRGHPSDATAEDCDLRAPVGCQGRVPLPSCETGVRSYIWCPGLVRIRMTGSSPS